MIRVIQGDKGYIYMPYRYMTDLNLVYDAYTIQKFSSIDLGQAHWKKNISELEFTAPTAFGSNADGSGEDDWSFQEMDNGENEKLSLCFSTYWGIRQQSFAWTWVREDVSWNIGSVSFSNLSPWEIH